MIRFQGFRLKVDQRGIFNNRLLLSLLFPEIFKRDTAVIKGEHVVIGGSPQSPTRKNPRFMLIETRSLGKLLIILPSKNLKFLCNCPWL